MSVDISVSITEDVVDIIATPTVNIVNVTNSASIDPGLYDLSEFTNTSPNPFVRASGLSSYVPTSRTITINGLTQDLSINRSWTIPATTWGTITGTLSAQTDLQTALNGKVPTSRTLTINGVTQDLSANRTFTISTGITIGSTAIASGVVGRVLFEGAGNVVQESSSLFWDNTGFLGIGTSTPVAPSTYNGITINSASAGSYIWFQTGGVTKYTVGSEGNVNYHNLVAGTSFLIRSGGSSYFNVVQSTGNVQIGTTTDAGFRLDVNGTARVQGVTTIGAATINFGTSSGQDQVYENFGNVSNDLVWRYWTNSGTTVRSQFRAKGDGSYEWYPNNGLRMKLFNNGNLLLQNGGTFTDAGFRLDVNGTARVQTGLIVSATNPTSQIAGAVSFSSRISGNLNGAISSQNIASLLIDEAVYSGTGSNLINYAIYAGGRSYFDRLNVGITSSSYASSNVINDTASASLRLIGYNVLTGASGSSNGTLLLTATTPGTMLGMTATYGGGGSRLTIFNQYSDGPTSRIKINLAGADTACFFGDGSLQIGNGETTIASAILSASSTTRGFLPPRMTTTQRNAIASPAAGLIVYDNTDNKHYGYNGTTWNAFY